MVGRGMGPTGIVRISFCSELLVWPISQLIVALKLSLLPLRLLRRLSSRRDIFSFHGPLTNQIENQDNIPEELFKCIPGECQVLLGQKK